MTGGGRMRKLLTQLSVENIEGGAARREISDAGIPIRVRRTSTTASSSPPSSASCARSRASTWSARKTSLASRCRSKATRRARRSSDRSRTSPRCAPRTPASRSRICSGARRAQRLVRYIGGERNQQQCDGDPEPALVRVGEEGGLHGQGFSFAVFRPKSSFGVRTEMRSCNVIPAEAGTLIGPDVDLEFGFALSSRARVTLFRVVSTAFGRRVTFSCSGHPALRPFGAAYGVRAAPAAQCLPKRK